METVNNKELEVLKNSVRKECKRSRKTVGNEQRRKQQTKYW
jgi:hypothetical protein